MTQSYTFPILLKVLSGALLFAALSGTCVAQTTELDPTYFDDNLHPVNLKEYAEPNLNLNAINQNGSPQWYSMITKLPGDWARTGNLLFRSESVPAVAGIGLLTFSFVRMDNQMWRATRKFYRSSQTTTDISSYAVALGDGRLHLGIAGVFAGYGWLADDPRALRVASQTVEAFLATGITVQMLKRITGRQSPAAATCETGRWKFLPHPQQYAKHPTSYYAFPSGHISTAMATLTVVAENYPDQRWLNPVGYTLVGVLGTGLVAKGMHWYSDLPLGIALGYVFGKIAASPITPGQPIISQGEEGVKVAVSPTFDDRGGAGIHFAMAF
jgi:hypothetical protein